MQNMQAHALGIIADQGQIAVHIRRVADLTLNCKEKFKQIVIFPEKALAKTGFFPLQDQAFSRFSPARRFAVRLVTNAGWPPKALPNTIVFVCCWAECSWPRGILPPC